MEPSASEPPRPVTDSASDDLQPAFDTVHLARFEFSDKGTKVLMVEWQPGVVDAKGDADVKADAHVASQDTKAATDKAGSEAPNSTTSDTNLKDASGWEVSWPGKSTQLPAKDVDQDGAKRRVYFLLPQDAPIPPTVSITRIGSPSITLKPLPAIFPEGFDVEAGTCGVLHTLWAKKRLSELDGEIAAEMRNNAEGIGLQMVIAEREWISDTFLSPPRPVAQHPITPRSPIGGRLGEKLKGLKLGTSPEDLIPSPTGKHSMKYLQQTDTNTHSKHIHRQRHPITYPFPYRR